MTQPNHPLPHYVKRASRQLERAFKEAVEATLRYHEEQKSFADFPDAEARRLIYAVEEVTALFTTGSLLVISPLLPDGDEDKSSVMTQFYQRVWQKALQGVNAHIDLLGKSLQ